MNEAFKQWWYLEKGKPQLKDVPKEWQLHAQLENDLAWEAFQAGWYRSQEATKKTIEGVADSQNFLRNIM